MMDVMGKLFTLFQDCNNPSWKWFPNNAEMLKLIEYLVANGVTVQEWISVDDKLPEDDSDVLAYLRIGEESRICPANYAKGMWFDCIFNTPVTESITHWMPIPQPPKGE